MYVVDSIEKIIPNSEINLHLILHNYRIEVCSYTLIVRKEEYVDILKPYFITHKYILIVKIKF